MSGKRASGDKQRADVVRTFICIEIPESIKQRIGKLQTDLRLVDAPVSWTKPSNIHLTLKFLGAVAAPRVDRVAEAVERATAGIGPLDIEVCGAGCFPSPRSPRVLWVGIAPVNEPVRRLFSSIEDELEPLGFPRDRRKFSPHLTIGRIRIPGKSASVAERLTMRGFEGESFIATEIIVMRSDLNPTGSVYTPQAVVKLR